MDFPSLFASLHDVFLLGVQEGPVRLDLEKRKLPPQDHLSVFSQHALNDLPRYEIAFELIRQRDEHVDFLSDQYRLINVFALLLSE